MARRRRQKNDGAVLRPGDPGYDVLIEQVDTEAWIEAGAPTPMAMFQQLQREREEGDDASDLPEWMTVEQVAQHYKWAPKTVRADIRAGRLLASSVAPGRPYRVRRSDAEAWAVARRAPTSKSPKQPPRRSAPKPGGSTFRDLARKNA